MEGLKPCPNDPQKIRVRFEFMRSTPRRLRYQAQSPLPPRNSTLTLIFSPNNGRSEALPQRSAENQGQIRIHAEHATSTPISSAISAASPKFDSDPDYLSQQWKV